MAAPSGANCHASSAICHAGRLSRRPSSSICTFAGSTAIDSKIRPRPAGCTKCITPPMMKNAASSARPVDWPFMR
jgi:hypothetical protein